MYLKRSVFILLAFIFFGAIVAYAAYHHEGERDADKFLAAYPDMAGTKLDNCALCHSGGEYEKRGEMVPMGSCQWCHYSYGYDGAGEIDDTINEYGAAYKTAGRNTTAITSIETLDSDGDGYTNKEEIETETFPGNADDHPGLAEAPYRIYTKAQLEAMDQHTQFLMMNTSRSGDFYAEYTGVPLKDLLDDAGILPSASGITVYAPDGWSQYHPTEYDNEPEMYHVHGNVPGQSYQYPPATYFYNEEADVAENPDVGWCDYSAPSCAGRSHGDAIPVDDGLKALLAVKRDGAYLDPGVLTDENKLEGEGPYRVVVPQKNVNAPDQSTKSDEQDVIWPYNYDWDHSAGACTRTVTIVRVEPLPEGTTDIDVLEAGWAYVDNEKIVIYGAIDGTDSNGNGILDSEEKVDPASDYDNDGTPDYMDPDTARLRHAKGVDTLLLNCKNGQFADVETLNDEDAALSQQNKPGMTFPYGALNYKIIGITSGASVEVTMEFPEKVPTYAKLYKITTNGWQEIDFTSNNGDKTIKVTLTDGDPATDADGTANGVIVDPSALGIPKEPENNDDDDSCFVKCL